MAQTRIPVLIVGAGGVGLSLSLLLQQQGIASVLVERRADVSWYPRARNLNFRTLEVFRGLGLEAQVIAAGGHVTRTLRKTTLASKQEDTVPSIEQAFRIDHLDAFTPEPAFWYCPQSRLEPLLLGEARRRGCDVRYGHELVTFTQDAGHVTATVADRATGATSVLEAEYLVAADGAHSRIRSALGVKCEGLGELDEHYVFAYFRAPWRDLIVGQENDAIFIDRPDLRCFFLITDADRGMLVIQEDAAREFTVQQCHDLVVAGIGKPDLPVEIVDIAHWRPGQLVAEHFSQGRIFLAGDAAHTMPPKLGLGVNTGIQSAQNLAWKLAAVLRGQASAALLSTYETERRPVGKLAAEQSMVGPAASLLTKGTDEKLLPAEKRISYFALIGGYRYRSQAILSEDTSVQIPDNATELFDDPQALTGQPGTRVPHLWLEHGGQRVSTLDLLDGGFVLFVGPADTCWKSASSPAAGSLGVQLSVYGVGKRNGWEAKMGVSDKGAVLVRPDGFVAWRTSTPSADAEQRLKGVLATVLCRQLQNGEMSRREQGDRWAS